MVMMDGVTGAVNRAGRTTRSLDIRNVMNVEDQGHIHASFEELVEH